MCYFYVVSATFNTIFELILKFTFYSFFLKIEHLITLAVINCQSLSRFGGFSIQNTVKATLTDCIFITIGFIIFLFASFPISYYFNSYLTNQAPIKDAVLISFGSLLLIMVCIGAKSGFTKSIFVVEAK
jgi:hypothetical protein